MRIWALRIGVGIALGGAPNVAFAQACDLPPGEMAVVSSVLDGKTLALQDGREVRLLGIKAPAPPPVLGACFGPLLAVEARASEAGRGLWRSLTYQVRDAHDPKRLGYLRHTYQLVEGQVHGIGEGRKLVYINFAEDWHHDFTVTIKRKRLPVLEAAGLDLESLPGAHPRARLGRMVERHDDRDFTSARDRGFGCSTGYTYRRTA